MKTKLNKSQISIGGAIHIICNGEMTNISLAGLNQAKSGVYEIRNKFNGKRYIGMAKDLIARKAHHISDLQWNRHKSKELQLDYDNLVIRDGNYFEDTFEFNVIIYCYPSQLTFYENLLITYLQPEYNHKRKLVKLEKKFDENGEKIQDSIDDEIDRIFGNLNDSDEDVEEEIM